MLEDVQICAAEGSGGRGDGRGAEVSGVGTLGALQEVMAAEGAAAEAYAWVVLGRWGGRKGRGGVEVPSKGEVARGLRVEEDVRSYAACVLGERVLTGERMTDHGMVGRSGAHEAARVSGGTSQLCRRALRNIGPRTALPEGVLEGVVRPWWRSERRGEVRGGDWWRLFLGGRGIGVAGCGGTLGGGGVERRDGRVLRKVVVPLALNGERPAVKVLDGVGG